MPFNFTNLTLRIRELMLEEVLLDEQNGDLYVGKYTNEVGRASFPRLLADAIKTGDEVTLAESLHKGMFLERYEKRKAKGGTFTAPVPVDANQMLAEGEFNRFYARAVCRLALEQGTSEVEIYRARYSENPRSESQSKIGQLVDSKSLLNDLRNSQGVETALGCPPGPRSGLSIRLPTGSTGLSKDTQLST